MPIALFRRAHLRRLEEICLPRLLKPFLHTLARRLNGRSQQAEIIRDVTGLISTEIPPRSLASPKPEGAQVSHDRSYVAYRGR